MANRTEQSFQASKRFVQCFEELRYRGFVKTKGEFAKSIGINNAYTLIKIESGTAEPTLTQIINLVQKYNISTEWLILGEGEFRFRDEIK